MAAISSQPQFGPQEVIYAIMNIPLRAIQLTLQRIEACTNRYYADENFICIL